MPPRVEGRVYIVSVLVGNNHIEIAGADALSNDQKDMLREPLMSAKQHLLGANCARPTTKELEYFLSEIFDGWVSGEAHQMPEDQCLTSGMLTDNVILHSVLPCRADRHNRSINGRRWGRRYRRSWGLARRRRRLASTGDVVISWGGMG